MKHLFFCLLWLCSINLAFAQTSEPYCLVDDEYEFYLTFTLNEDQSFQGNVYFLSTFYPMTGYHDGKVMYINYENAASEEWYIENADFSHLRYQVADFIIDLHKADCEQVLPLFDPKPQALCYEAPEGDFAMHLYQEDEQNGTTRVWGTVYYMEEVYPFSGTREGALLRIFYEGTESNETLWQVRSENHLHYENEEVTFSINLYLKNCE